ncbi:MAG: hypothetical protein WAqPseu_17090 [Shewanella algae]
MIYREKHIGIMTDNAQSWRDTPTSPSVSPKAVGANNVAEAWPFTGVLPFTALGLLSGRC